jgi:DNA-binding winged helix-turn-helix (wHTH) protein
MRSRKSSLNDMELDLGRYELRRQGRRVKLEKKPMELLIFLVSRREQLVSRQEIVARLWRSNLFIETETNINNIVRKLRAALGDDVAKPRFLETVVGKGYRFVGPVRVIDARYPRPEAGSSVSRGRRKVRRLERALVALRDALPRAAVLRTSCMKFTKVTPQLTNSRRLARGAWP